MSVVERQMLDQLLQELNLGTSEIASADTQKRLGQVLSAGTFGFINFGSAGPDKMIYLRAVDTESTRIVFQSSAKVDEDKPLDVVDKLTQELLEKLTANRELKGVIAEASADDAIIISLGAKHGVAEGQEFTVVEEGEPITANGRVIAHRQNPIAKIAVTQLEPDYAICKLVNKKDGAVLAKDMKIKSGK
ncbi:MAG: hypothetical protein HYV26_20410 [Candidatus Hydrogenedentes bacterium]|nr:hypothetical protein [Candidatus Hydrogenedentota bacterium]